MLAFWVQPAVALAQTNLPLLTTAGKSISSHFRRRRSNTPFALRAVVTFVDVAAWQLFVQDETGASSSKSMAITSSAWGEANCWTSKG